MLGWRLPRRVPATPPATQAEAWLSSDASAESISETSTWRPRPPRGRASKAAWAPLAALTPPIQATTRAQRVAVQAPAGHQPGAEGLHQHVGAQRQRARELAVALVGQVERDRALVAVDGQVV